MKVAATFVSIFLFASPASASAVCGLFQVEDFRVEVVVSLIDSTTFYGLPVIYKITNAKAPLVSGMVVGQCYCVAGDISPNSEFSGDPMYQLLNIRELTRGPFPDCSYSEPPNRGATVTAK